MTIENLRDLNSETLFAELEQGFEHFFHQANNTNLPLHFVNYDGVIMLYSPDINENELVIITVMEFGIILSKNAENNGYNLGLIVDSLATFITDPPIEHI